MAQGSWAVQGELEQFLPSWQGKLQSVFLREFPVCLLSDAVSDLNLAAGRKLWQPIQITLFEVKLNQSFSLLMVLVSPEGQEVSIPTPSICFVLGRVWCADNVGTEHSYLSTDVPHFKRLLGLWANNWSVFEFFLCNFKFYNKKSSFCLSI